MGAVWGGLHPRSTETRVPAVRHDVNSVSGILIPIALRVTTLHPKPKICVCAHSPDGALAGYQYEIAS